MAYHINEKPENSLLDLRDLKSGKNWELQPDRTNTVMNMKLTGLPWLQESQCLADMFQCS